MIRRRGPDASSTISGKCVGQFPAKRQEAKSGETRHHAPGQIWSRQPAELATGARSGRGRSARPPGGHRHSATSRPSDSASDRGRTWGPATCNLPTADSRLHYSSLQPSPFPPLPEQQQPICSRYPLGVCFQSFRRLPACVPQYSCPSSWTAILTSYLSLSPPLRVATRFESWRHRQSSQRVPSAGRGAAFAASKLRTKPARARLDFFCAAAPAPALAKSQPLQIPISRPLSSALQLCNSTTVLTRQALLTLRWTTTAADPALANCRDTSAGRGRPRASPLLPH